MDAPTYPLTNQLLSGFDAGDQRKLAWVGNKVYLGQSYYYPNKYKVGRGNSVVNQPAKEYYMVLRFAEAYLIRAEASANGAPGGTAAAITDLNIIRDRADLEDLSEDLSKPEVIDAVAKENQTEFFAEWGHRWFDLKRTGKASAVLSAIPLKQPWTGDYQLLFPIPLAEITRDHFLIQNPDY